MKKFTSLLFAVLFGLTASACSHTIGEEDIDSAGVHKIEVTIIGDVSSFDFNCVFYGILEDGKNAMLYDEKGNAKGTMYSAVSYDTPFSRLVIKTDKLGTMLTTSIVSVARKAGVKAVLSIKGYVNDKLVIKKDENIVGSRLGESQVLSVSTMTREE